MEQEYLKYKVDGSKTINLKDFKTRDKGSYNDKENGLEKLEENKLEIIELQNRLYAQNEYALLIIFQALDAAGKDSAIKHVMSGINPQGFQVYSFKAPSSEELDHGYLWRTSKALPERGRIGIFNRSYYEDVLVVKVRNLIDKQNLPKTRQYDDIWARRYRQISAHEKYLFENAIIPVKFFLNVSKEVQKERFIERIDNPAKNWKFSQEDLATRALWDDYQTAYEDTINQTATKDAPWFIIPADRKWYARLLISEIILDQMKKLELQYPKLSQKEIDALQGYKAQLLSEK